MTSIEFTVNTQVYPLEVVYLVSYGFVDRCYVKLDGDPATEIKVKLQKKSETLEADFLTIEGQFNNELLHASLRQKISQNNVKLREYVVGRALYSLIPEEDLIEDMFSSSGNADDPLGIQTPWEEKYGKDTP